MKKVFFAFLAILLVFSFISSAFAAWVSGYTRSDGTYVSCYYRSSPNSTVRDNYSYKGNLNPYTGKSGTSYYRTSPTSGYYNSFKSLYKPFSLKKPKTVW